MRTYFEHTSVTLKSTVSLYNILLCIYFYTNDKPEDSLNMVATCCYE